jgi:glycerol-3-phosphate cytidylyltransferase
MIVERHNIKELCEQLKSDGKTIVFTNGCFDILHSGHVFYLQKAKQQGDILILGLNSDASVRRLKGEKRPINNENDRAIVISELKSIDYVVIFEEDTPLEIISLIVPDILVKGGDYKKEDVVGKDIVENNGGEVVIIPFVDGKSTTNIINKINE